MLAVTPSAASLSKPVRTDVPMLVVEMKPPQVHFARDSAGRITGVTDCFLMLVSSTGQADQVPCTPEIYQRVDKGIMVAPGRGSRRRAHVSLDQLTFYMFVVYRNAAGVVTSLDVVPEQKYKSTGVVRPEDFDRRRDLIMQVNPDGSVLVVQRPYTMTDDLLLAILRDFNAKDNLVPGEVFADGVAQIDRIVGNEVHMTIAEDESITVAGVDAVEQQREAIAALGG